MSEKWTLEEAKGKLFGDDPELDDLVAYERKLPSSVDISIAEGKGEYGEGLSVILTLKSDDVELDDIWNFSFVVPYRDGMSKPELVEMISKALGIGPDERVWEDGGY